MESSVGFEPKIVAFLCNWCTYTGADLAGVSRIQYPSNVRPIRVMCSGSVDPMYILKALLDGADGVLIGGCHGGDCHYVNGNYKARRRIAVLREVLDELGTPMNSAIKNAAAPIMGGIICPPVEAAASTAPANSGL
jgi:F420-non-reducing hydrogenase iron-sulfur subunit